MSTDMPQPPLNPEFWDQVITTPPVVPLPPAPQFDEQSDKPEPPSLNKLQDMAHNLGLCGATDSGRVCVRSAGHKGNHQAKYIGGPKDGQVIHWWRA